MGNDCMVNGECLKAFINELFLRVGLNQEDAGFHANALIQTNYWGIDSHGVIRVPAYVARMENGAINVHPTIREKKGGEALVVLDADGAAGFIGAREGMRMAIEKAKINGIAACGVMNSNHFGAGALYARMAAEQGMIGIAMTNVKPLIISEGASQPVTGNNPIAVAVPTYLNYPFVLDMSLSVVAGGKLTLAIKKNEKIPMHWATDSEGYPTDDPKKAFEGFLLPIGAHKGLGISYVVDILSGIITGGTFSKKIKSMYANPKEPSETGHFFIAIDISKIIEKEEMKARMSELREYIKSTPMWKDDCEMIFPGELEYRKECIRKKEGIPVPRITCDELLELAQKYGVKSKLEFL